MLKQFKSEYVEHGNFPILFVSILIFFIGIAFFENEANGWLVNLLIFQVFAASIYTVSKSDEVFKTALILGVVFVLLRVAQYYFRDTNNIYLTLSVLFMFIFMGIILKNILGYLLVTDQVNINLILGVISGYLLIGVLFSFGFTLSEVLSEQAAINFEGVPEFKDILYFTMITQTTIGYGDYSPQSDSARFLSYSLGVIGQLYMGIVMAFIIGKFLQPKPDEK